MASRSPAPLAITSRIIRAMHLNANVFGPPAASSGRPPLLIAHGLFGSARNWGAIAKRLALHRQVIAVDLRNHGDSPRSPDQGYAAMAGDLAETIAAHGGRADVLGHSMGGKAAMVLALSEPDRVRRLIVADIAPVAYAHSQLDYVRAMQAVDLAVVGRRSDADAALAARVPEPALRAFLLQSLAIGANGAAWKLNLAALADQMPAIMDFPELGATLRRPDAVRDRGGVGLRAARALAAHPRAVSRRRAPRDRRRRPLAARRRARRRSSRRSRPSSTPTLRRGRRARTGRSARPLLNGARAAVAQLVEHVIRNDGVGGSSPFCGTTKTST